MLKTILKNDWTPWSLLNTFESERFIKYDNPIYGRIGWWAVTNGRTELGKKIDRLSAPVGVVYTIFHYLFFAILWLLIVPLTTLVKNVLLFFTSDWENIRKKW